MRITQLTANQIINAGYGKCLTPCEFIGFTTDQQASVFYPDHNSLRKNVADKEIRRAVFRCIESGEIWHSYRYNGRWRVWRFGSSALKLAELSHE